MPESTIDRGVKKNSAALHAASIESVIANLRTNVESGLSKGQASRVFQSRGPNELTREPPTPAWKQFVAQFRELVIVILIVAALIAGALGDWIDTIAILAIVLVNGIIGYFQQSRAERALAALDRLSAPLARVLRGGRWLSLETRQLVPGDIVELESGDFVPADLRLVHAFGLNIQEASLTGESAPVAKDSALTCSVDTPLAERSNMAYMGTVVTSGKSKAVVVATGNQTELGLIAGLLKRQKPEPTPLQNRLSELGRILIYLCIALVVLIFTLQMLHGEPFAEAFLLSVSLVVAAVPEGLPAVVTIALAIVLKRMVKRNALVRRLPSVETLGSVTVICSDKTGTLTRNEMTVREVHVATGQYSVAGAGFSLHGSIRPLSLAVGDATGGDEQASDILPAIPDDSLPNDAISDGAIPPDLGQAIQIGSICNNARLTVEDDDSCSVLGDPTEAALLVLAGKTGFKPSPESILHELPFDSNRKAMSVVVEVGNETWLFTKGAPEVILARSISEMRNGVPVSLDESRRTQIVDSNRSMASRALRVLGLAMKKLGDSQSFGQIDETDLVFVGLVGMIDPPRAEVREAVVRCNDAGIKPVMITGDHPDTALAIARELGIAEVSDTAVSGPELDAMSDSELVERVSAIPVYARVTAEHKMRIVNAWKANNQIVAMTGDGVNDSPAVRAADIGIAMGITGTDVTKQASDQPRR